MNEEEKEKESAWYVMQVATGREQQTIRLMEAVLEEGILKRCFVPMRKRTRKCQGKITNITERLFPGYVFLITEKPLTLYLELKGIPTLMKLLGNCEELYTPLSEKDIRLLQQLKDWEKTPEKEAPAVELSRIAVEEGKQITIMSGPLKNLEGLIKKVDLHKRIAVVEVEFMGQKSQIHLGIEMVQEKGNKSK